MPDRPIARHFAFALFCALTIFLFREPLRSLVALSLNDSRYTHIAVTPLLSASAFLYVRKPGLRKGPKAKWTLALLLLTLAAWTLARVTAPAAGALWPAVTAVVALWAAAFAACYGIRSFRETRFAFGLLLFMIPIPAEILEYFNRVLQRGSAEISYLFLKLTGVPVLRDGFRMSLPGIEIEVARQCSGIRSAIALVITGTLAGYVVLRTAWARIALVLLMVPIAILKNAFRIATIAWLSSNVDESIIDSVLHRRGGLPFSMLAVAMLATALFVLRKSEARFSNAASPAA